MSSRTDKRKRRPASDDNELEEPKRSRLGRAKEERKRKPVEAAIGLLEFIKCVLAVVKNTNVVDGKCEIATEQVDTFVLELLPKTDKVSSKSKATEMSAEIHNQFSTNIPLLFGIHIVSDAVSQAGRLLSFSREALKFYLATYSGRVDVADLVQGSNTASPGAILNDYCKSMDLFISNLNKATSDDIGALKLISEQKLTLPVEMYNFIHEPPKIIVPSYKTLNQHHDLNLDDYAVIPSSNFKPVILFVTSQVLMLYENEQFVMPCMSVERDVKPSIHTKLEDGEYMLLELLSTPKFKILDVITMPTMVPDSPYFQRISFAMQKLPDLPCIDIKPTESSHILKANYAYGQSYYIEIPNLVAGVVGLFKKSAYLAYKQSPDTLIIKKKINLSGPMLLYLLTRTTDYVVEDNKLQNVRYNDKEFALSNGQETCTGAYMFKNVIGVEMKDSSKIGGLTNQDISAESKCKATTDQFNNMIENILKQSPDQISKILNILTKHAKDISECNTNYNVNDYSKLDEQ